MNRALIWSVPMVLWALLQHRCSSGALMAYISSTHSLTGNDYVKAIKVRASALFTLCRKAWGRSRNTSVCILQLFWNSGVYLTDILFGT